MIGPELVKIGELGQHAATRALTELIERGAADPDVDQLMLELARSWLGCLLSMSASAICAPSRADVARFELAKDELLRRRQQMRYDPNV